MTARGTDFMERLAQSLAGGARLDALEAGGKCARRLGAYGRALESLRTLAAEAADDETADRARWLVLDVLLKARPSDLSEQIARESAGWHDAGFFTDLLEVEVSSLVADRKWKDIYRLSVALEPNGPAPVRAQLYYILARALQEKLILRVPGAGQDRSAVDLLRAAIEASPNRYYGVLAACLLGDVPRPVESAAGVRLDAPQAAGTTGAPAGEEKGPVGDPLTQGFISFGLTSQAFDRLWAARDSLEDSALIAAARSLSAAGDHRRALNLIGFLSRKRPLAGPDFALFYPRAYRLLIENLAARSRFPVSLLYGLVREESYFDEKIVSSAGAVGLAQLMPDTAADAARILHIKAPDLTDPETNLSLGVEHLRGLYVRVGSVPMALLAYNAGLRRSKRWDRVSGWLSTDLFVEAVPYGESREYVRKILVSAVMYAYLYGGEDARETVKLFYPDAFAPARQPTGPLKAY
jgi:soluble lytic murein transglycosylase